MCYSFTLLRLILGDFNFYDLEAANRVLGPVFFLSYIFFVFFVLMVRPLLPDAGCLLSSIGADADAHVSLAQNMFLAIINDTYAEVKSELADSEDDFAIMDYFKSHYHGLLGKLGKHQDQIDGIQAALKVSVSCITCPVVACICM